MKEMLQMRIQNATVKFVVLWIGYFALLYLPQRTFAQVVPLAQETFQNYPNDLVTPAMLDGAPGAGKRVKHQLEAYKKTGVFHALYLPANYVPGKKYPVIFEFAGNGPFENRLGDKCTGKVEDCNFGFGISGGRDFIWVCVPFVSKDKKSNQLQWWGNVDASVEYCKQVVALICKEQDGDPERLFLCGFSRGSIACNYIGLHDDEIAKLWCGMICHSHYDGVRRWNYPESDVASAKKRLTRLKSMPQFICQENSVEQTKSYLKLSGVEGNFTFLNLSFANHTDQWVLKDLPERQTLRRWVSKIMEK